jgi:hypothetical protein
MCVMIMRVPKHAPNVMTDPIRHPIYKPPHELIIHAMTNADTADPITNATTDAA